MATTLTETKGAAPPLLALALALAVAPLLGSCDLIDCGEGTIEADGTCVPADTTTGDGRCGDGTMLAGDECVPVLNPTECDENTTEMVVDEETGVITCVGTGGPGGCDSPIACPAAEANKVTVCGQLIKTLDSTEFADPGADGSQCTQSTTSGPCSLDLIFYDALDFANNPAGAVPLQYEDLYVDTCGRYRVKNVSNPQLGFLAIGADDAEGNGQDQFVLTGVVIASSSGLTENGLNAYVTAATTDQAWTTSAGDPFGGATFSEQGVFAPIFLDGETSRVPVSGVQITRDGAVVATDDYYFSDATATTRSTIDADQDATGANGAGLMTNSGLVMHSGEGGGCEWGQGALASAIPGVVFVAERFPESGACP